jgi:hypothetical protein
LQPFAPEHTSIIPIFEVPVAVPGLERRITWSLRAVALGRRNYLFAGAHSGGEPTATIYSLVGTAKLNGLDPELYLRPS